MTRLKRIAFALLDAAKLLVSGLAITLDLIYRAVVGKEGP